MTAHQLLRSAVTVYAVQGARIPTTPEHVGRLEFPLHGYEQYRNGCISTTALRMRRVLVTNPLYPILQCSTGVK